MSRRWACGFGLPEAGDGGTDTGSFGQRQSPAAGGWYQGSGIAFRAVSAGPVLRTFSPNIQSLGAVNFLLERFWIRVNALPASGTESVWIQQDDHNSTPHFMLSLGADGWFHLTGAGTGLGTYPNAQVGAQIPIGTWHRILLGTQISLTGGSPATTHVLVMQVDSYLAQGFTFGSTDVIQHYIQSSNLGNVSGAGAQTQSIDIRDWGGDTAWDGLAAPSTECGADTFTTPVQAIGDGLIAPPATPGQYIPLSQIPPNASGNGNLPMIAASEISLAFAALDTTPGAPIVSFTVAFFVVSSAGTHTFRIDLYQGGSSVAHAIVTGVTSFSWGTWIFPDPTIGAAFDTSQPFELGITNQSGSSATIANLVMAVESSATPPAAPPANSLIYCATGTYVGNGVGQAVALAFDPDLVLIGNNDAGDSGGVLWWRGLLAAHDRNTQGPRADRFPYFYNRPSPGFAIGGSAQDANQSGKTYQYVAYADALGLTRQSGLTALAAYASGAGLTLADVTAAYGGAPADAVHALVENFAGGGTAGAFYRGPGHTGANSSPLNATQAATALQSLGPAILVKAALANAYAPGAGWLAWKKAFRGTNLMDCVSYTGDGTASQIVAVNLSGHTPCLALIVPHNGASWLKLNCHGATQSMPWAGGGADTAHIIGWTNNQVTAGANLNSGGILYDVFVLAAGKDGGVIYTVTIPPGELAVTPAIDFSKSHARVPVAIPPGALAAAPGFTTRAGVRYLETIPAGEIAVVPGFAVTTRPNAPPTPGPCPPPGGSPATPPAPAACPAPGSPPPPPPIESCS